MIRGGRRRGGRRVCGEREAGGGCGSVRKGAAVGRKDRGRDIGLEGYCEWMSSGARLSDNSSIGDPPNAPNFSEVVHGWRLGCS